MKKDTISLIIPIYNGEKYLKRCLDSIINQTYKNIEIICINDGSKDSSLDILNEYQMLDNRIVIIDKENAGVSAARNDGIIKSTGEYITFVDADDWLELDAIESLYNALIEKSVDVVRANYYRNFEENINDTEGNLYDLSNKVLSTKNAQFSALVIDRLLDGSIPCFVVLLLIKKDIIVDGLSFKEEIKLMEDKIFYNELFNKINTVYFLDKPIYHYYCNENSCTKSSEHYIRNMYNILKVNKYLTDIIKNSRYNSNIRLENINTSSLNMIINHAFIIFKDKNSNSNAIKRELDKLMEEEYIQYMINNSNIKRLPIHLKIPIILVCKRKYNLLFAFYRFRTIMSKVKDIITKRKE